jgi:serine O-acetyltransferase
MSLGQLIRSDYRRYVAMGNPQWYSIVFLCQGLWASFVYRVSHRIVGWRHIPVFSRILRILISMASKFMEILTGISVTYDSEIGPGLHITHFGTIIIGSTVVMGRNCCLSQGVTIGAGGHGAGWGVPTIGDRVFIGPNAVIVGKIRIGNDVLIGAGAVVSRSIPDRAVVLGNPGRIVWFEGSFELVRYDGMADDPERLASMALVRKSTTAGGTTEPPFGDQTTNETDRQVADVK